MYVGIHVLAMCLYCYLILAVSNVWLCMEVALYHQTPLLTVGGVPVVESSLPTYIIYTHIHTHVRILVLL